MDTVRCGRCKFDLPQEAFSPSASYKRGYQFYCKKCNSEWHREYRYGISASEFATLLERQNNRCAVCPKEHKPGKRSTTLHVDHDHATGKIRGLLCTRCNTFLGVLEKRPNMIADLLKYKNRTAN